jgi:hypothetical protein
MTSRVRTSTYKESLVTVRWQELKRADPPGSLYIAGYALTSADGRQTDWRQINSPTFHTHDTAVAYALREAHRFIDSRVDAVASRISRARTSRVSLQR